QKRRLGALVHYVYGGRWGASYGLLRESKPAIAGPLGIAGFSTSVMLAGEGLVLPTFRLAAWPQSYPVRNHLYTRLARLVSGAALAGTYEALTRPRTVRRALGRPRWAALAATAWILGRHRRAGRLPESIRPILRTAADGLAALRGSRSIVRARDRIESL